MRSVIAVRTGLLLVIGLALGGGAALVARNQLTVGQDDPCFGLGELVSTRTYTVTDAGAANAEDIGLDLVPGEEREVRECQVSPVERLTIDGQTGKPLSHQFTIDDAIEYYRQHPEEIPATVAAREFDEGLQQSFVTPQVPTDLTAGCDPTWVRTTLEQVKAVVCHPADWLVKGDDPPEGMVGTDRVEVGVLGVSTESHITKCLSPLLVNVPSGTARVCARGPTPFARVTYGVALPNGRNVGINVFNEATPEEEALALRVAANVQQLP